MNEKELYSYSADSEKRGWIIFATFLCFIIPILWWLIPLCLNSVTEFVVTDRRIRLKKLCGEWTEIPMDNVCVITKTFWFAKLLVGSASGVIGVWGFGDRNKVFELLSKRICERQTENAKDSEYEL